MAPSEGPGGDPAAEEGPTGVTRSSRSGPTTTRYLGDRPAAATRAGECDADGVEEEEEEAVARRGYYPNSAPRRSTPAAGEGGSRSLGKRVLSGKEAVPRCGCYGDTPPRRPRPFGEGTSAAGAEAAVLTCGCYRDTPPRRLRPFGEGTSAAGTEAAVLTCGCYRDTPPRRPRPFGEGTSAAGAEEAVLTCGCYRDTPPRRLVGANSTRLGHKGGVPRCIPTLVRPGSDPTPCVQNQLASGGGRGHAPTADLHFYDGTSEPHAPTADLHAKIGSEMDATFCIPVVAGGRGDGGGRGCRDGYIYGCTARPHTFMPAPTSDLAPKDKATSQTIECMEEGYLAKIVPANAPEPKAPKANAVQLSNVKSADPDGRILKADIEDYSASVAKGGKCESSAASGLDCTSDIPNAQIRKVTANCLLASKQTIPQYYLTVETRADELIKLRGELNPLQEASGGKKIPKDLVIKDADKKRLGTLGEEVKQLAQRARDNNLKPQDYEGGTFTQSNLGGPFGIRQFPAILNPPQSAILAIGSGGHDDKKVMIPTQDGDKKGLGTIGEEVKQLAQRAKESSLKPHDYEGFGPSDKSILDAVDKSILDAVDVVDPSELLEFVDGAFVCSDRGGCLQSNKMTSKDHYLVKMNLYLRTGSMRDVKLFDEGEGRNSSLRFEELKGFKNFSNSSKGLVQKMDNDYYTEGVSQVFIDFCGSTISHQQNLNTSNVNMLLKVACDRAGVKPNDIYSIFCGKFLDPEKLLSHYHINKDSTIIINSRLRGGCYPNWDAMISGLGHFRFHTVSLPQALCPPQLATGMQGQIVQVKYLGEVLQFHTRKALIHLCRRHFSGECFGGQFTSEQIAFDEDGNAKINAPRQQFTEELALLDYKRLYYIFEEAFNEGNVYPMHTIHLLSFLQGPPADIDPKSESVIAILTNHVSLLSHTERIAISGLLDLLFERLDKDDKKLFKTYIAFGRWGFKVRRVPAMKTVYLHFQYMKKGKQCVPCKENRVSLLRFSTNFFKHSPSFTPEELEAAFYYVMASDSFIPQLVYDALVTFKDAKKPCTASVLEFVKQAVAMLGKNTIGCTKG